VVVLGDVRIARALHSRCRGLAILDAEGDVGAARHLVRGVDDDGLELGGLARVQEPSLLPNSNESIPAQVLRGGAAGDVLPAVVPNGALDEHPSPGKRLVEDGNRGLELPLDIDRGFALMDGHRLSVPDPEPEARGLRVLRLPMTGVMFTVIRESASGPPE
jgi:hypothetical protein